MKRFLLLFFSLFLSFTAFAQLEVKPGSFKKVDGFVNINTEIQSDDNDVLYSVIKVRTENINDKQRHELLFEGNAATFIELEYKVGEVWVYLSSKPATYLKISHPDLSSTEFWLPFDLEPKQGYEMVLVNKTTTADVPVKESYNYLVVKADQSNAVIYIDGQYAGEGEGSQFFKVGETHTWSIECAMYHSESGSAKIIKDDKPVTIEKILRPAFGFIKVTSQPESGASVFIDNNKIGESPCTSGRLASGEHKVRVMKELYATTEMTYTVTDGNTTEAVINMPINYVNVTINTDAQSDIYINNERKGKGTWSGRLSATNHVIEAKKASHKTTFKNATLTLGHDETIVIPDPTPIYGTLNVNSTPMGATIFIDGKNSGTTPKVFDNILIGSHEIKIEKEGMATVTKQINLDETNMMNINEKLVAANTQNNNQNTQAGVGTTTTSIGSEIIRFQDDFNGNSLNSQYWTSKGDVKVNNGMVTISQSQTDKDMTMRTKELQVPASKKIAIERKFRNHKANNQYHGGYTLYLNGNENDYVGLEYDCADYEKWYGTKTHYKYNGKDNRMDICDAIYDTWLTEKVIIDFGAGTLSYYRDNNFIKTVTIPGLSSKNVSYYYIRFHSYGWWTGHYCNIDYIRISDVEGGQTTSSQGKNSTFIPSVDRRYWNQVYSQNSNERKYCDGVYGDNVECFYPGNININRNKFRITFDYEPMESTKPAGQYVLVLSRRNRILGVYLTSNGEINITTNNQRNSYPTGLTYKMGDKQTLDIEYNNGTLKVNGVQLQNVDINRSDGDNVLCSINYSNGTAFHGYISNVKVYNGK